MAHDKPAFVTVAVGFLLMSAGLEARDFGLNAVDSTDFFSVAPCRAIDTRLPDGPLGGPAWAGRRNQVIARLKIYGAV